MARRLIGLDIGTNAVTIAEVTAGNPPRLDMFAQVALPRDAMREGEVADAAAITDAVTRLRTEVGLKKVPVRIGIASPRVVVRQVEMPVMTRDELMSALQFQAGDLIPIPIEEAVLDFAILGTSAAAPESGAEPTMQVLLVAAYEATIAKLVSAIEAGGLDVGAVDLIPLALTRALARPVDAMVTAGAGGVDMEDAPGAEGIVSFGGGVTAIAVHEGGIPQFVRVLGNGGRELTDAIATDLGVPPETAEALKRALANPAPDEMVARARTSIDRPLSVLLDEVRSSIDYYRNQPGSAQLRRVVVTGGSAQLPGLPERLAALVGVPVEPAYMHDLLRIGDIGFAPEELPRLEPYLPAPVGLALGGANLGTVIDLRPKHRKSSSRSRGRIDQRAIAAAAVAIIALGGLTYMAHGAEKSAQKKNASAQAAEKKLRSQIYYAQQGTASAGSSSAAALKAEVVSVLGQDVAWPAILGNVALQLPPGVHLKSFTGTHTIPAAAGTDGHAGKARPLGLIDRCRRSRGLTCRGRRLRRCRRSGRHRNDDGQRTRPACGDGVARFAAGRRGPLRALDDVGDRDCSRCDQRRLGDVQHHRFPRFDGSRAPARDLLQGVEVQVKTKNILVGALVVALVGMLWYRVVYSPMQSKTSKANTAAHDADTQSANLRQTLKSSEANKTKSKAASTQSLLAATPADPAEAAFLRSIEAIRIDSGAAWQTISPSTPAPNTGGTSITVAITVSGTEAQVARYLDGLMALKRIFVIDNVAIAPGGSTAPAGSAVSVHAGALFSGDLQQVSITGRIFTSSPAPSSTGTGAVGNTAPVTGAPAPTGAAGSQTGTVNG